MPCELSPPELEQARALLCRMEEAILAKILDMRQQPPESALSEVAAVTAADTIYHVDQIVEEVILDWFEQHWPEKWPVQLIMEGLEEHGDVTFPKGTPVADTILRCIIDPIDGTRMIMYDKRSAWALAALSPQKGDQSRLQDIRVAAMTELPTTKQWRADQLSCVRGQGLHAESINVFNRSRLALPVAPSKASHLEHGFATLAQFFPEGKELVARIEGAVLKQVARGGPAGTPIFSDQYLSTGGQFYELAVGHDLWLGDIRPVIFDALGYDKVLVCHPYDVCCALILEEAGVVIEAPDGSPLDAPLDTVSPVAWVGYANKELAEKMRPLLQRAIETVIGEAGGKTK